MVLWDFDRLMPHGFSCKIAEGIQGSTLRLAILKAFTSEFGAVMNISVHVIEAYSQYLCQS